MAMTRFRNRMPFPGFFFFAFLAGFVLLGFGGCSNTFPEAEQGKTEEPPPWMESLREDMERGFARFRIGSGDVLESSFQFLPREMESLYRLGIRDTLVIEFFYQSELNRTLTIRPDGRITLPLIGDIKASGKTPEELRLEISHCYDGILRKPEVTVTVKAFDHVLEELKNGLVSPARGQSRLISVGPDGWADFPLIGGMHASGKTMDELQKAVNGKYQAIHGEISVVLSLAELNSCRLFVLGEVRSPGSYPLRGPTTVLEAISVAGGNLRSARLDSVVIISRDSIGLPRGKRVNVEDMMAGKVSQVDPFVRSLDVIYVPKTFIAKVNDFVEMYIKGFIMFNGFNIPMVYDLHREFQDRESVVTE